MRKRTIFKMFIIPLLIVMLAQALITYASVILSGSTDMLADYSADILDNTVENRKNILENDMVQQWSNVKEEKEQIDKILQGILRRENINTQQFLADESLQNELLHEMLSSCLYMLRKNAVTGSFIVIGRPQEEKDSISMNGIYFRDVDPYTNSVKYSDVLMERGSSKFAHELEIPLDNLWSRKFHFRASGESAADSFFYKPYQAAKENPGVSYQNLGYWSTPFYMEDDTVRDSYQMITYSIPLVYEDGTVYGVMGVEISKKHLLNLLPIRELKNGSQSSYVLAQSLKTDEAITPLIFNGFLGERIAGGSKTFTLTPLTDSPLYRVNESANGKGAVYASVSNLYLYNTNTPFAGEEWLLIGFQAHDSLFGFRDRIIFNLSMGILTAILFSCIAIYVIAAHVTSPIRKLAQSIRIGSGTQLGDYKKCNIQEVDELYEVVRDLTEKQKQNEYTLREETERYRVVLESSTDVIFTYDIKSGQMELININSLDIPELRLSLLPEQVSAESGIHPDHYQNVREVIQSAAGRIRLVLQMTFRSNEPYEWMEVKGTVIYDADGERSKIIGSIKNIHEQTLEELKKLEEQRKDAVSGLLNRNAGELQIRGELSRQSAGCMAVVDIDDFRILNEEYGMVFGDVLLEELGRLIQEMIRQAGDNKITAVRIGGDEFLFWLAGVTTEETERFIAGLQEAAGKILQGGMQENSQLYLLENSLQISLTAGIAISCGAREEYASLLARARKALAYAKKEKRECLVFERLPKEVGRIEVNEINEIASISYTKLNIVALMFNFFDKGGNLNHILAAMLMKLGRYFGTESISIVMVDRDFRTTYSNNRWTERPVESDTGEIRHFTLNEFEQLTEGISTKTENNLTSLTELERRFLFIPQAAAGITVPMFDRECYIGSMNFLRDGELIWTEKETGQLHEIVKIIESNINREKHDLASQAKSDFLSRMSHEIRTPMNAIIGMTTIALTENDEAKITDCLQKIAQSSRYLLGLINHILDMSKIESGKMKLAMGDFNLNTLVQGVENLVLPQMKNKNINFKTRISLSRPWVTGDELRLSQVLVNLLGNAAKFTEENGNIILAVEEVSIAAEQAEILFFVQDDGIGISEENQERIFHSFEQAEGSTGKQYGGTGLGLSISRHLIQMMGGTIELESKLHQGCKFYFTLSLPLGMAAAEEAAGIQEVGEIKMEGKRLLLVEDNSLNMEIAQTLLEMQGFVIEGAVNGLEAVEKFGEQEAGYFDVILMDIRMPVMDGLEATKAIRKLSRPDAAAIPIIAMTANAFDEDMKKSLECGMNGHLAKPIDMQQVMAVMKQVLSS